MTIISHPSPLTNETVCVTGASGFIGSWLVLRLLQRGYTVRATVRDPSNAKKVKHLEDLPNAKTNLTLWKADMGEKGSYDEAIHGCTGVFHVATPMFFETEDPENDMIKPTVEGMLDIMRSCVDSRTVKRLVFTSSAGTVDQQDANHRSYDETCWSNIQLCRNQKMTGWMYFVSKTMAEQAAWAFAKEQNFDFVSIIPTLVVGPFLNPEMPPSLVTALSLITGNEAHYMIITQGQFVHLDDLCQAHIFLYENRDAKGRYICSSDDATIFQIARMLKKMYPEYDIPTEFKGVDEKKLDVVSFSSRKLRDLGFEFKYGLEDMFKGAVESCREKGLSLSKGDNK